MSYLKQVLAAETAKQAFEGLTDTEKSRVDDLYFKDDWKQLQAIVKSATSSPALKAYAKDQLENLNMIAYDKKMQQRT